MLRKKYLYISEILSNQELMPDNNPITQMLLFSNQISKEKTVVLYLKESIFEHRKLILCLGKITATYSYFSFSCKLLNLQGLKFLLLLYLLINIIYSNFYTMKTSVFKEGYILKMSVSCNFPVSVSRFMPLKMQC